jgi:hypothetical protein
VTRSGPCIVSSLPIMEKEEQFLRVRGMFALLCSHDTFRLERKYLLIQFYKDAMRVATKSLDASPIPRGGKTSPRPLRRAAYRAPGTGRPRPMAHVSPCAAAAMAAMRLALRHQGAREPLGPLQDAIPLPQGLSVGAGWPGAPSARRWGRAPLARASGAVPRRLGRAGLRPVGFGRGAPWSP